MERRLLEVTVISASDLKDVRDIFRMHPYVVASLFGDERHKKEQCTPVDEDGGTSPRWDHSLADPFTVDVAEARAGHLTLKLEIKTRRTFKFDKHVGCIDVPVKELLEQGGDGEPRAMRYDVRLSYGGTRGVLEFSYKFGEAFIVHGAAPNQPPANRQPLRPGGGRGWYDGVMLGCSILNVILNAMLNDDGDDLDM